MKSGILPHKFIFKKKESLGKIRLPLMDRRCNLELRGNIQAIMLPLSWKLKKAHASPPAAAQQLYNLLYIMFC